MQAGGGADEANALLADAAQWTQQGQLSATATNEMAMVLGRIDGVDPSLATSTTAAPTTVPTTLPPEDNDEPAKKRGKGRDD